MFTSDEIVDGTAESKSRHIFKVSELNRDVQTLLESAFPLLWVEGEISNFSSPSSGHWYFTLKDSQAQIRCAMFRNRNRAVGFKPDNGKHVIIRARVSLYEPRGDFQLVVENMESAGDGALQRAYEELKKKLNSEGLFETARKKPLPNFPRQIGVITSPTGAAIRDILSVLKRRFPAISVLIYPVPVQGSGAGNQIASAIALASEQNDCDVLILARGGGSLEDLWSFNEEIVARAIAASLVPIVSGVGHEIDFTIADFVADRRAPTPSAAAEMVVPDQQELLSQFVRLEQRLASLIQQSLKTKRTRLDTFSNRVVHPSKKLIQWSQRLDELEYRLHRLIQRELDRKQASVKMITARLQQHTPRYKIEKLTEKNRHLAERLCTQIINYQHNLEQKTVHLAKRLETVSPLATISRGYAIVFGPDGKTIVRRAAEVKLGDEVTTRLGQGQLLCTVKDIKDV